jgi:hypothetical protein
MRLLGGQSRHGARRYITHPKPDHLAFRDTDAGSQSIRLPLAHRISVSGSLDFLLAVTFAVHHNRLTVAYTLRIEQSVSLAQRADGGSDPSPVSRPY